MSTEQLLNDDLQFYAILLTTVQKQSVRYARIFTETKGTKYDSDH